MLTACVVFQGQYFTCFQQETDFFLIVIHVIVYKWEILAACWTLEKITFVKFVTYFNTDFFYFFFYSINIHVVSSLTW